MKQIPLKGKHGIGKFALVDDEDYEYLIKRNWFYQYIKASDNFYVIGNVKRNDKWTTIYMSREVTMAKDGDIIDHKNRNTLDNQKSNLRKATKSQNNANRRSISKTSTKYLGVFYRKDNNTWRAILRHKTKAYNLGQFPFTSEGEIEAAKAYDKKAKELHGEFANLNFP